jgi:serine protease
VATTGYGDLDNGGGDINKTYTATFQGTSSASPIVTGAAVVLQALYQQANGTRLSGLQMRGILANPATGTPQGGGVAGNIGVMPNLHAISLGGFTLAADVYLRDFVGDTGAVPSTGAISASPDVIVRKTAVANPTAAFGAGSGTENSSTLGSTVESGQNNFVYVRMLNRGGVPANGVTVRVYWSPPSTLITPNQWNLVGTTAPVNVPAGNTLVVAPGITWPAAQVPPSGHYCFVALASHPGDPAPPTPASMTWNDFTALVRNQNNVTWRNFNVEDVDPSADPAELKFQVAGAHDRARVFDLEVIAELPRGAELLLEVPLELAELLRGRDLKVERVPRARVARVHLPAAGRTALGALRLEAKAVHRARFVVRGGEGYRKGKHSVAIRQIYQKLEVGRVTWAFHPGAKNDGGQR